MNTILNYPFIYTNTLPPPHPNQPSYQKKYTTKKPKIEYFYNPVTDRYQNTNEEERERICNIIRNLDDIITEDV